MCGIQRVVMQACIPAVAIALLGMGCASNPAYPLHDAVRAGDVQQVQALIGKSARGSPGNRNQHGGINDRDIHGDTSLVLATSNGNLEIVKALVAAGADVNARTIRGFSPLIVASQLDTTDVVKFLVASGAAIDPPFKGPNAISEAIQARHLDLAALYVAKGANLQVRNDIGETPLFYAALFGDEAVIRLLLEHGADIDAVADDGRTALHAAVMAPKNKNADLLLDLGARVRASDGSEVALYSTALVYERAGIRALDRNDVPSGLTWLSSAADYYSSATKKFEAVANDYQSRARSVQMKNVLTVVAATLLVTAQARVQLQQAKQIAFLTGDSEAIGVGYMSFSLASTESLKSFQQRYHSLAGQCGEARERVISLIACAKTAKGAEQSCLGKMR